jgi:hypothetical protein
MVHGRGSYVVWYCVIVKTIVREFVKGFLPQQIMVMCLCTTSRAIMLVDWL